MPRFTVKGHEVRNGIRDENTYEILVDQEDLSRVSRFQWFVRVRNFMHVAFRLATATERRSNRKIYLHNEIMQADANFRISPRNGNWLDCRKENLCRQPVEHYLQQAGKV